MTVKFLYFDLGIVLVDFSFEQMLGQLEKVSGIGRTQISAIIFESGLQHEYELGHISTERYYEEFCRRSGTRPAFDELRRAASEIFTPNAPMFAIAAKLHKAGRPLGILSNTCDCHWEYCFKAYPQLHEIFSIHALSYRLGATKPDAKIFHAAARLAGYAPEEIFFVDDLPGHVAGAKAVGFDAVQYTTAEKFAEDLKIRRVEF